MLEVFRVNMNEDECRQCVWKNVALLNFLMPTSPQKGSGLGTNLGCTKLQIYF